MSGEVTLSVGCSAEVNTCGSCLFFERQGDNEYYRMNGFCRIKLPAKIVEQFTVRNIDPKQRDREYTGNEDQIKDTDRCDLYRPDGKIYIVQRRVTPEKGYRE